MKVLIACEFSGIVRDAFIARGHDAMSCDLLPTERPGPHHQGDVLDILNDGWDLMIAHPPCTYLTCTGNKWFGPKYAARFPNRHQDRENAVKFFMELMSANVARIAVENPIGIMSTRYRKPDQIIHPYHFGHKASKATCLWLKNLPCLSHTKIVERGDFYEFKSGKRMAAWYCDAAKLKAQERTLLRSKTFQGIADAMADQWGEEKP